MARIREVHFERRATLDDYLGLDHVAPLIAELRERGRVVAELLGAHRIWMLNSAATGGGVAELLPRVCGLLDELGVDARWLVLEPENEAFFRVTKAVHNALHGVPVLLDAKAREIYDKVSAEAAGQIGHVATGDVLVVHDPQPAGIPLQLAPERRPRLVWRCHVGLAYANEYTARGWSFLHPLLEPYDRLLFSAEPYIPGEYVSRSGFISPGIDPLSHKNRELRPNKLVGVMRSAGLLEGPPVESWARFVARAKRLVEGAFVESPVPDLLFQPFVLQVSRFDRLKGFDRLIPSFERLLNDCPNVLPHLREDLDRLTCVFRSLQLILAGPAPGDIADDPEANDVLQELVAQHAQLPEALRRRVHLLVLPLSNVKQNALMVNALQRTAAVVIQNSRQEGFGLTVSEALWKGAPMVGSNVGGIAIQIRHGLDGVLVDDPEDTGAIAAALMRLLTRPREAEAMGRRGRSRVRDHFLVLTQVRRWLIELEALLEKRARTTSSDETIPGGEYYAPPPQRGGHRDPDRAV